MIRVWCEDVEREEGDDSLGGRRLRRQVSTSDHMETIRVHVSEAKDKSIPQFVPKFICVHGVRLGLQSIGIV